MDFLSARRKKSGVCGEVAISRLLAEVQLYIYACSLTQLEWNEASSNFFQPANWVSFNFPWYINYLVVRELPFYEEFLRALFMHPISVALTTGLLSFMHIYPVDSAIQLLINWNLNALLSETKIFNSLHYFWESAQWFSPSFF